MENVEPTATTVTVTDAAFAEILKVVNQQDVEQELFVRVYVQGGPGGLAYGMALDSHLTEDDWVRDDTPIKVVVDKVSKDYVLGATVDYQSGDNPGFRITNPFIDLSALGGGCCSSGGGCGGGSCGSGGGCC